MSLGASIRAGAAQQTDSSGPPPTPTLVWHYTGQQLLDEVGGVDSLVMLRGSDHYYFDNNFDLQQVLTDGVPTTFEGLAVLPQDTTRHWKANDGTGGKTPGFGGKGTQPQQVTVNYVAAGAPSNPQTGYTECRQDSSTNEHRIIYSDVDAGAQNDDRPMVHMVYRVVGNVPRIRFGFKLRNVANDKPSVDINPNDGTFFSSIGLDGYQYKDLENGWHYLAVWGESLGGIFNITTSFLYFMDALGNKVFTGNTADGLDVFAFAYGDIQDASLYNPILSPLSGNVVRFEPSQAYAETNAGTGIGSDYTIFFQVEARKIYSSSNPTLIAVHADVTFNGWAFVYDPTSGQLRCFRLVNGVTQEFAGVLLNLPDSRDVFEVMLEVIPGAEFRLTVDNTSAISSAVPGAFPTGLTRFYQYFNDVTTERSYGIYSNMKRVTGTGWGVNVVRTLT